jgi:hypothetical protein
MSLNIELLENRELKNSDWGVPTIWPDSDVSYESTSVWTCYTNPPKPPKPTEPPPEPDPFPPK